MPRSETPKAGQSIPMPSVELKLPKHVLPPRRKRNAKTGEIKLYFYFQIRRAPEALASWRETKRLPIDEKKRTGRGDAAELAAIEEDARRLTERYEAEREGLEPTDVRGSIPWLIREFDTIGEDEGRSASARKLYAACARKLSAWSATNNHRSVADLTVELIRQYLKTLRDTPTMRLQVKGYLTRLLDLAVAYGVRPDNPAKTIKIKNERTSKGPWTRAQIEERLQLCLDVGRPSLAMAILIGFEVGQRRTDIDAFRKQLPGDNEIHVYNPTDGNFRFDQSKTGAYVAIPATQRLRSWIDHFTKDQSYLLISEKTGEPYKPDEAQRDFKAIQEKADIEVLQLRFLRHSCVCRLADAGCTITEICSVTGHKLSSAQQILDRYWRPTETQAVHAIAKVEGLEREQMSKPADETESKLKIVMLDSYRAKAKSTKASPAVSAS